MGGLALRRSLRRVLRAPGRATLGVGEAAGLAQAMARLLGVGQRKRAGRLGLRAVVGAVVVGPPVAPAPAVVEREGDEQADQPDRVDQEGQKECESFAAHAFTVARSEHIVSTASAAWRPESRLPPPARASA